jgi:predicted S18 family serine protease
LASFISQIEGFMPKGEAFSGLEKDIQADREARKSEKSQAGWMRLAEAGFNIASGTSPYALANIGKGASEALKGYADDLKEQKKLDREDKKLLADIEKARREEKRGNITAALGSYEKALDRASGDTRARIAAEASRYAADKESPQVQLINTYAKAKNIPFDQALREVATAQAEGKDPLLGMIQSRVAGGANREDILKALEDKFGPLQSTR